MSLRHSLLIILEKLHLIRFMRRVVKYKLPYFRYLQKKRGDSIRKRGYANVVFVVINLPMWRAQGLYDLLKKDSRFNLYILMGECKTYTTEENERNISTMKRYFQERGMDCYTLDDLDSTLLMKQWNPDVIFYTQPYNGTFSHNVDCTSFKDRLTVFIPYGFMSVLKDWNYNSFLHNMAWRVYYPTEIHKNNAVKLSICKGDNVRVVGEPHADYFLNNENVTHKWKDHGDKKRIIWAPHFQITPNAMFNRPSFLWTHDVMVEIAKSYQDKIHIAFKPHPRLYSELCNHPDWGEERAKQYYELWDTMPNTQVETGEFIDLFKESDALIHDCGSFVAEYMFVCKPCMFLTHDEESVEQDLCDFGKKCFHLHDIGRNREDIIHFIEEVVLNDKDTKLTERKRFYNEYLIPPYGQSTAINIYNDMTTSLFGK